MQTNDDLRHSTVAINIDKFDILKVIGKGVIGRVYLVKLKKTGELYALKAMDKHEVLTHK